MSTLYVPAHFAETRTEIVESFLRQHPFCSLVTSGPTGLFASHLPMRLDVSRGEKGVLRGHLARANPHWKAAVSDALAIFSGPGAYVSPSYYPSKQNDPRTVPTWNYSVVHVLGKVKFIHDPQFVRENVTELTEMMESNRPYPWQVSDAPDEYIGKLLHAIVGVEIEIQDIQAKFKLSQNRKPEDVQGVVDGLSASAESAAGHDVAKAMRNLG